MATIKSFTSLKQSKVLAKILPIKSADMCWCNNSIKGVNYTEEFSANLYTVKEMKELFDTTLNGWDKYWELIPCWSLAALLSVIPKEVKIKGQRYAPCLFPTTDGHWLYKLWYNSNAIIDSPIAVWCDNPLDACVEMIIKINEQKLL